MMTSEVSLTSLDVASISIVGSVFLDFGEVEHMAGSTWYNKPAHLMAAGKQRGKGRGLRQLPKNTHPVTYVLQLGPPSGSFHTSQ
jgi:hypothetical protein